jgi:hypothetical protein
VIHGISLAEVETASAANRPEASWVARLCTTVELLARTVLLSGCAATMANPVAQQLEFGDDHDTNRYDHALIPSPALGPSINRRFGECKRAR